MPWHIAVTGILFLLYATASLVWSSGTSLWTAGLLGSFVLSFTLGYKAPNARLVWLAYGWFMLANVVAQCFTPMEHGVFGNPNFLGCALVMAIAGAVVHRLWYFLPAFAISLYLTNSRGAILAAAVLCFVLVWKHYKVIALALATILAVVLLELSLASDGAWRDPISLIARLGIWQDTVNHLTIFGSGWGSFATEYASWPVHRNMTLFTTNHAYNDVLELIFELGIGVIPLWLLVIFCLDTESPNRLIILAFLTAGLTFFPLYLIPVGQLFAMTLGNLARERKPNGQVASNAAALFECSGYGMGIQGNRSHYWPPGS